jgi:2-polyprenyl-6-methoxyphenol hydroxylase-like FAD-dependent oxidoreductase
MTIDGVGFTAVGRLRLLKILQREARSAGVDIRYNEPVRDLAQFHDADLIVGADGLNSLVRGSDETRFGTSIRHLANRFAWFGTTKTFDALTQTFVASRYGHFNAHHYRYAPAMSTFIVECDETTFLAGGFDAMDEDRTRAMMQEVFAEALDGHPLVSNRSVWRRFPVVRNEAWSAGNKVILGDALHTAHFSIGSGTRLAIEDAIALVRALKAHRNDVPGALARYEAERKPVLDVLVTAANASAAWYERFAEHMALPPYEFAMSYLMRTGRMTEAKLGRQSPRFMADYERHRGAG